MFQYSRLHVETKFAFKLWACNVNNACDVCSKFEPTKRNLDYICAYIQNGQFYNGECTTLEKIICEIDAIDNSQTTASTQMSTQTESTSAEILTTTYTSAFDTHPTILSKATTPYDVNTVSSTGSTGHKRITSDTFTTEKMSVVQSDNATILPCTFLGPVISALAMDCIIQCTSDRSENVNSTDDTSLNSPYKVDFKSLSSYRRSHQSAHDPRMSSMYIGCEITCTGSDWMLDGAKCLKIISGSPDDGQAQCSNEDSSAALMLAPTSTAATDVAAKL
ncbi:unnamed protein product [Mytilus coruscus]|uniref:Uncharacterized protein n=1 Tax=Mytilus coruscus TaxID=42192 RepID=A0A6J8BLP2_MYTCO|nr:unnamed protein product [Mytilus coruscus]